MNDAFNSQALIIARESRGYSQAEVGRAAGLSQGHISKVENDVLGLTSEQVERVARFLEYPPQFFYEPGQLRDGASVCHYHRKRKTLPAKVLNKVNATMFARNVAVRHLLNGIEIAGPRQFHSLDPDEYGSPTAVARAMRQAWRIAPGPIRDLTGVIESAAGIVILAPFGNRKLFGMSCWPTRDHPLFFLNAEISTADLRWTMAHELGHLIMHGTPSTNDVEAEADEFAAEFLTPAIEITPQLQSLRFEQLGPLKMHWRVSMKTLIRRGDDLSCYSHDHAVRLYKRYSAARYNEREPYDIPAETPTLLARAAEVHVQDHKYAVGELQTAIRTIRPDEFTQITGIVPASSRGGLSAVR